MSVPISLGMLVELAFLVLSYRQTTEAYPTAGGAYRKSTVRHAGIPSPEGGC